jgi:hypothetical protein
MILLLLMLRMKEPCVASKAQLERCMVGRHGDFSCLVDGLLGFEVSKQVWVLLVKCADESSALIIGRRNAKRFL